MAQRPRAGWAPSFLVPILIPSHSACPGKCWCVSWHLQARGRVSPPSLMGPGEHLRALVPLQVLVLVQLYQDRAGALALHSVKDAGNSSGK